jgi:hypothetical protein
MTTSLKAGVCFNEFHGKHLAKVLVQNIAPAFKLGFKGMNKETGSFTPVENRTIDA